MRGLRAIATLLTAATLLAGFSLPPELSLLVSKAKSLDAQIEQLNGQKSKLETRLEELATKIDRMKEQRLGPVGRTRLERLLAQASEVSEKLEGLELELQNARQRRAKASSKIAAECERRMAKEAELVKFAETKKEARSALEAYLAYRNLRDTWSPRPLAKAQEFLIPQLSPSDTLPDLRRKLELIDDLTRTLVQLKGEIQKQLGAMKRELELEREILERSELRKLFEEGEIETFGTKLSRADLEKTKDEIERLENWLRYLDNVHSELTSGRGEIDARIKEIYGNIR